MTILNIKKRLIYLFLIITVSNTYAQDFESLRIYINPGHGGHDSNDRYMAATGFYESDGNLTKGLYLRDLLEASNAVVFMSRTQNRTQDDLRLSQIAADANANDADIFHSIHSNGWNGGRNSTLMLYRGYDNQPVHQTALDLSNIMVFELYWANRTTGRSVRGDWSFYPEWGDKVGLGVLRTLQMPGTLSEGSFHDYVPESWRLMCIDYRKHEAIALYRSFVKLLELTPPTHGVIAGIVRDKQKLVTYDYTKISSLPRDKYKTIDEAQVILLPDNKIYRTDNNNNGFYIFDSVEVGDYQVVFASGDHENDTLDVSVESNKTNFADAFLNLDPSKPPYVETVNPADQTQSVITHLDLEINFSRGMDIDSTSTSFSIVPETEGTISWQNNGQKMIFTPRNAYLTSTEYTVTISTKAMSSSYIAMENDFKFSFTTAENHINPQIVVYYPSGADSFLTDTEIVFDFDMSMRQEETKNAFSTTPQSEGIFSWKSNNTRLIYKPSEPLLKSTDYTVTLSTEALNRYGVPLAKDFSFNFTTKERNQLSVLNSFPKPDETGVSPYLHFYVEFDARVKETSIGNKIRLYENGEEYIRCNTPVQYENNGKYFLLFDPRTDLKHNTLYKLLIVPGIRDTKNIAMKDTLEYYFTTNQQAYESGNVFESLDSLNHWQDPVHTDGTVGTDTLNTSFDISDERVISGNTSGKLNYKFLLDTGGVCRLCNSNQFVMPTDETSEFGLWVFGDFSHNILEFWFEDYAQYIHSVVYDTIDWAGWKLIRFPISDINSESQTYFNSIVIRQLSQGLTEGRLYFDEIQCDITVPIENKMEETGIVDRFYLFPNYPNPFNPQTNIQYSIMEKSKVELGVYNIIGRKIVTLVDEIKAAGIYNVKWHAGSHPSGVYFIRMKTKNYVSTRKMILVK